jgi:hypothetical protein
MLANLTAMVGEPANSNSPRGSQVRCVYLERYFPISPMMRLGHNAVPSVAGDGGDEARTTRDGLETWPTRVAGYGALSQADKLSRAALGFRVSVTITL